MDSTICYGCALESLIGNGCPEEGDCNSALLISGEMTDQEARWLQEDLESIDHSGAEQAWRNIVEDDFDPDDRYNDPEYYDED